MHKSIIQEVSDNLGAEPESVAPIIDEFMLHLHKKFQEYKGLNGDYISEELHYDIGKQAIFHLLGIFENYNWERGIASEYLLRLGTRADWAPFSHQMEGWIISRKEAQNNIDSIKD